MKYCEFNGCTNKIAKGAHCDEHKRSKKSAAKNKKKKDIYHHENKSFYKSDEWKTTRDFVYERDGGCCQRCGKFVFGRSAHVHHKIPIKKNPLLKLDLNNLILLCPKCHIKEENKIGEEKVFPTYFG